MKTFRILTRFNKKPERSRVFALLGCGPGSPAFGQARESFREWEGEFMRAIQPRAFLSLHTAEGDMACGTLPAGAKILTAVLTLGPEVSRLSTRLFAEGDYLAAMLVNAMSDERLSALDSRVMKTAQRICAARGLGCLNRLESPGGLISAAVRASGALAHLGLGLTEGGMLDPVKSSACVLVLSKEDASFCAGHDCAACTEKNCALRKLILEVEVAANPPLRFPVKPEQTLMDTLPAKYRPLSPCGGRGTCGRCGVRVVAGELPVTPEDRRFYSPTQLQSGWRLSCRAKPKGAVTILPPAASDRGFQVLDSFAMNLGGKGSRDESFGIAMDLGTTTLAMVLIGLQTGRTYASHPEVNSQRRYGADVISRIQAANEGRGPELQRIIREDLRGGVEALLEGSGVPAAKVARAALCGNTAMAHLLMGYPCQSLGVAPFAPHSLDAVTDRVDRLLGGGPLACPMYIFPGLSGYVGGDIVAGLLALGMEEDPELTVLMDLGTNGEIALGNRGGLYLTATAAGPAFEGGGISCGTGSVSGAIRDVTIASGGQIQAETIGDEPAVGLCGSGIIAAAAELLKAGLMDETGLMDDSLHGELVLAENVRLTQRDVREVQLAKAAIRAGLEALMRARGAGYKDVAQVYLAGGLGSGIDPGKAAVIGLLPPELAKKAKPVGNSALGGAARFLIKQEADRIAGIQAKAQVLNLGGSPGFSDLFMEYMTFE